MGKPSRLLPEMESEPENKMFYSLIIQTQIGSPTPYIGQDGDTLENLEQAAQMRPGTLSLYNFGTDIFEEINWHFNNSLGCDQVAPDRASYFLSDSAQPGVLFFPLRNYKLLVASGRKVGPIYEDTEHKIRSVPFFHQGTGPRCWAAAVSMMLAWQHGREGNIEKTITIHCGARFGRIAGKKKSIYTYEMSEIAVKCGLRQAPKNFDPETREHWFDATKDYGPLLVGKSVNSAWAHWLVVTGYRFKFPDTCRILYGDPGAGPDSSKHIENFMPSAKTFADNETLPYFYHW